MPTWIGTELFGLALVLVGTLCWTGVLRFWAYRPYAAAWTGLMPLMGVALMLSVPANRLPYPWNIVVGIPALTCDWAHAAQVDLMAFLPLLVS